MTLFRKPATVNRRWGPLSWPPGRPVSIRRPGKTPWDTVSYPMWSPAWRSNECSAAPGPTAAACCARLTNDRLKQPLGFNVWAPGIFNPAPISAARSAAWFALKEAAVAGKVAGDDFQATIIYMDMRTFGKTFERYGKGNRIARGRSAGTRPGPLHRPYPRQPGCIHPLDIRDRRNPRGALRSGGALHRPAGQRHIRQPWPRAWTWPPTNSVS